jgi:C4-dicarboxylate-specific signal transduction histidine kinase
MGTRARVDFEPVDVAGVLRAALGLSNDMLAAAQVEVRTKFSPDLPSVMADRAQLTQVVLNLISNSCDAMRGLSAPRRQLRLEVTQPDPGHVQIFVADSGSGLPNIERERLFEPFVTTKPEGMGLGLGGRLSAEPNAANGATFRMVLPVNGVAPLDTRSDRRDSATL